MAGRALVKKRKAVPAEDRGSDAEDRGGDTEDRGSRSDPDSSSGGWEEEEEGYSDCSSSVDSQQEIQVDFEAREIEEGDFHGIRRLLQQVLLKANVDLSGLTNLIINQSHIGSTIKVVSGGDEEEDKEDQEEGEEVYGITTVLNLTHHKAEACVHQISDLLLSKCKAHCPSLAPRLQALLTSPSRHVGLLLNERFLNIPPAIAPPLLQSLLIEMKEAQQKCQAFDFSHYVVIARSHLVSLPVPVAKAGKKRSRKGKAAATSTTDEPGASHESPVFDYFENELLQKVSVLTFSYPVEEESDSVLEGSWSFEDEAMKPYRTVMILPADKLENAVAELEIALKS